MAVQITIKEAVKKIIDKSSVMIGGFLGAAVPLKMIDEIAVAGIKDLTVISIGAGYRGGGVDIGKLVLNKQIIKYVTSHVGTDPNLITQIMATAADIISAEVDEIVGVSEIACERDDYEHHRMGTYRNYLER